MQTGDLDTWSYRLGTKKSSPTQTLQRVQGWMKGLTGWGVGPVSRAFQCPGRQADDYLHTRRLCSPVHCVLTRSNPPRLMPHCDRHMLPQGRCVCVVGVTLPPVDVWVQPSKQTFACPSLPIIHHCIPLWLTVTDGMCLLSYELRIQPFILSTWIKDCEKRAYDDY